MLSVFYSQPMLEKELANGEAKIDEAVTKKTYTIVDCFRTPNLRKISICTSLLW